MSEMSPFGNGTLCENQSLKQQQQQQQVPTTITTAAKKKQFSKSKKKICALDVPAVYLGCLLAWINFLNRTHICTVHNSNVV